MFKDRVLMITGGTGTFGNAVLRRFLKTDIKEIRIFSRDEKKQEDILNSLMRGEIEVYTPDAPNHNGIEGASVESYGKCQPA